MGSPYPWAGRGRPVPTRAGAALVGVAAGLLAASRLFTRVVVEGPSMLPELSPGDRLLVLRAPVLVEGDIVALRDPSEPARLLVKRVHRLLAQAVWVEGDNEGASRDSRHFGPVPRAFLLGRVVYRYHPAARSGPLRRRS